LNILYVCLGNICRSPMAEFMLRNAVEGRQSLSGQPIVVHGAGVAAEVGSPATREVRAVLAEVGISGDGHVARQLTDEMLEQADLVLVATEDVRRRVLRYAGAEASKVQLMLGDQDLSDPWGMPIDDYRETFEQLKPRVEALAAAITL
jgi:protein-tyrosine phosphatase